MSVLVIVGMWVGVEDLAVAVEVFVDEVDTEEEREVGEDLLTGGVRNDGVLFAEDQGAVGDAGHDVEVVGGGDEGFPGGAEADQ